MKRLAAKMTVSCKRFRTQALAAGMCAALTVAAFADDSAAHTDEALAIDVPAGQTVTYSGVLSGTTSIAKTGKGTLVLSNGANSFTGGITISAGIVKVTAAGALGADANAISIAGSTSQANQLEFAAAGATFANPITITAAANSANPVVRFTADTTFAGVIDGTAAGFSHRVDAGVAVTFNGTMNVKGKDIIAYVWGDATYNGKVTCNRFNTAGSSPYSTGTVKFAATGHSISTMQVSTLAAIKSLADNALPSAANYQHKVVSVNRPDLGVLDLGGHSQSISRLSWSAVHMTAANTGCLVRSPGGKASLTLTTGGDGTFACLMDDIDLVIDFANAGKTQTFSNRLHQTCGNLTIKNGIMNMEGTCAFQNVSNVVVCGGTLNVNSSTALAFASVTNLAVSSGTFAIADSTPNPLTDNICSLALGSAATIRVPAGMTLRVKDFVFNGSPLAKGPHSAALDAELADRIAGGGEIYVIGAAEPSADTWTGGGGADTALATAANWAGNASPDLETGLFSATFASGGTSATVSGTVAFGNVALRGVAADDNNSFSFTAADDEAAMEVLGDIAIEETAAQAGYTNIFAFAPPVVLQAAEATVLSVPTNDTLSFAGGLTASAGITLDGTGGTLAIGGDSAVGGTSHVNAGMLELSGTFGSADASLEVPASSAPLACLKMNGATVLGDFTFAAATGTRANTWLSFAPGTSNEFAGVVKNTANSWNIPIGGSTLVFSGGIDHQVGKLLLLGSGTLRMCGKPMKMKTSLSNYFASREHGDGLRVVWEVASNSVSDIRINTDGSGCTFRYCVDDVFAGNASALLNQMQGKGTHDFGSTTQRFAVAYGNYGTLTGTYPSALVITRGVGDSELSTTNLNCMLTGGLGLVMAGERSCRLYAPVSYVTTCGDLAVESGVLEIAARSGWMHGTNVFVKGGVLKINTDHAFDKNFAQIHFAGDGKIEVPAGVCQKFAAGWDDGVRMRSGITYTKANLPTHVSGDGSIRIAKTSTTIVLR